MIDTVYIEAGVTVHPRTRQILARFPAARRIPCGRYAEVFNRKAQSFRLQKRRPALILAEKHDGMVAYRKDPQREIRGRVTVSPDRIGHDR